MYHCPMDSLFDYIKWIGPYTFKEVKPNTVDQLLLATLCYIHFESFYKEEETLKSIAPRILDGGFSYDKFRVEDDVRLLEGISKANRFKNLILTTPKANITSIESESAKQFGAISLYDEEMLYICFRGTDATLVGWKEDFNMSFTDAVPADLEGLEYLEATADRFPDKKIIVTGHSKGGHVATYSYINAREDIKKRVLACYNNDGPGFGSEELSRKLDEKTHTIVPESSIIGMLMSYSESYKVVKSNTILIFQHNPYTWELSGPDFAYTERTSSSIYFDKVIHSWLKEISKEHREFFVDTLFDILNTTKATSFHGFTAKILKNIPQITKKVNELEPEDKKMIAHILKELFKSGIGKNESDS